MEHLLFEVSSKVLGGILSAFMFYFFMKWAISYVFDEAHKKQEQHCKNSIDSIRTRLADK